MSSPIRKPAGLAIISLLIWGLLITGCTSSSNDNPQESITSIANPYEFSVPEWEFDTLIDELWESLKPATKAEIDDVETVREYFGSISSQSTSTESEETELAREAQRILAKQIREVLIEEGVINPLDSFLPLRVIFPPINFKFEAPPSLLVVSHRDEIRLVKRVTLESRLGIEEKEGLEAQVDSLGYSSLVVRLGGVGFTYPTMIVPSSNVHRTIDRVVEEWFHQYMFFQPLGFLYALDAIGWRPDYDIIIMNETAAGIVSKEIAAEVYNEYYASGAEEHVPSQEQASEFDLLMRDIRIEVDKYLANGQVTEAEEFMQESRDFLASKGYHIRKLNQAYFAFYGTYADEPSTVSSIGQDMQTLRRQCSSLKEFLDKVKRMKDYEDLEKTVEEKGK